MPQDGEHRDTENEGEVMVCDQVVVAVTVTVTVAVTLAVTVTVRLQYALAL